MVKSFLISHFLQVIFAMQEKPPDGVANEKTRDRN